MSAFCRIRKEHAQSMSELATFQGLEHDILEFSGDKYSGWVTFRLTNHLGGLAFENLCAENHVTIDGTQVVHQMMDTVLAGASPEKVIDEALTPGIKRAMANGAKYQCRECGQPIPRYVGRYPGKCPECRGEYE